MSYGTSSGNPGSSSQVGIQHVQAKLHSLLEYLEDWSYVALWSFNPQSRCLEWTGGRFAGNSPARSDAEDWNIHLFNLQKTCTFSPGRGSVGMAFAKPMSIWRNGRSVYLSAGSDVQAGILEHARIETAVYIPSAQTVLELGTSKSLAEDMLLMNKIREFMWEHILPALGHAQAPPHVSQSPLAPLLSLQSQGFLNQGFELNEQARRTPSTLNIDDLFLQLPNEDEELGLTSSVPTEPTWVPSPTTSRPTDLLQSPNSQALPVSAASQVLRRFQDYRSLSGTTSSSLSSLEDTSVKLSVDSPDPSISLMAPSSQRHNSHNYASSSARRETPTHSPDLQLVDPSGVPVFAPHLHEAFRHLLDSQPEPWPQFVYIDQPDSAFKTWRQLQTLALRRRERSTNQGLLRRSFDILRQIRNPQQSNQPQVQEAAVPTREGPRRLPSSSSPEDMPARDLLQDQAGPSSRGRRPSRGTGTRGSGNDEAAKLHMLSERERRKRQKENFAALRKLVPIISKNDKASILGDAIIYIKDLHVKIQDAQAERAAMQSRYETLKSSHQELQERNKQLEALVAATSSGGASSSILPPP